MLKGLADNLGNQGIKNVLLECKFDYNKWGGMGKDKIKHPNNKQDTPKCGIPGGASWATYFAKKNFPAANGAKGPEKGALKELTKADFTPEGGDCEGFLKAKQTGEVGEKQATMTKFCQTKAGNDKVDAAKDASKSEMDKAMAQRRAAKKAQEVL